MGDRVQQIIASEHHDPDAISVIDETYHTKKGEHTPGAQRLWCGTKGATDNCIVTVHLTQLSVGGTNPAKAGGFRCRLDSELFLPEKTWSDDRERCRRAGIPDDMVYRAKPTIALELIDRAGRNGVHLCWLTFDAGYGKHIEFRHTLEERGVMYVGEVPGHRTGWPPLPTRPPIML